MAKAPSKKPKPVGVQALDRGLEIEDDGKVYLAGFSVDVQLVD